MTDLVPVPRQSLDSRITYAKALAASDLLPRAYQGKPANVLLAIEYGDALGLAPIAAIQGVHIVDGKPTASAQLIGALVRRAGHRLRVVVNAEGTAAKATIVRSDDPDFEFTSIWTMERAQAAGLIGKGTWKQYPAAMLKARAITEVARDACPEALSGVAYTAEELGADEHEPRPAPVAPAHVEMEAERPAERVRPSAPIEDDWSTAEPPVDEDGVIVEAEIVEDRPRPGRAATGGTNGPLARDIATRHATDKQVGFLSDLARKAGHLDLDAYLASSACRDALDGDPGDPLTDGQARLLIDALKAEVA